MIEVLGIDLASANWSSNGSAQLTFEPGAPAFNAVRAPAVHWPATKLTSAALADVIDDYARRSGCVAVSLDGPQGWRDPATPPGTPGVGRRCEYECRTQAKTGAYPQTFPGTQRRWVEFSVEVFDLLLARPGVRLADMDVSPPTPGDGYLLLESFPTSLWRSAGLTPLPAKSRQPDLRSFAERLFSAFGIPRPSMTIASHDDLQAVVAAIAAAAAVGGPAVPLRRGVSAVDRELGARTIRTEGYIWDAMSIGATAEEIAEPPRTLEVSLPTPGTGSIRVTQAVIDQVARAGHSQAQIALKNFPRATNDNRVEVSVRLGEETHPLIIGDSRACWASHQTGAAAAGFDHLFGLLSDQPDVWIPVDLRPGQEPARATDADHLASHGPNLNDPFSRTVSIPIRVVKGKVEGFDRPLPGLDDCVGTMVVPAFAVRDPEDLD